MSPGEAEGAADDAGAAGGASFVMRAAFLTSEKGKSAHSRQHSECTAAAFNTDVGPTTAFSPAAPFAACRSVASAVVCCFDCRNVRRNSATNASRVAELELMNLKSRCKMREGEDSKVKLQGDDRENRGRSSAFSQSALKSQPPSSAGSAAALFVP